MGLNKPHIQNNISPIEEEMGRLNDKDLLQSILNQEYILVIGSEAILEQNVDGTDNTGDSQVLLYHQMLVEQPFDTKSIKFQTDEEWQKIEEIGGKSDSRNTN